jgi:hypothetical protein
MSTLSIAPTFAPTYHRPSTPTVRLTRRGRLVVFLVALAAALLLGVLWGAGSVATERPGTPEPTTIVQVAPGDTLYEIAAEVTVDGDVAAMVERIQRLNALDTGMLQAGQRIRVPITE